jgi:hypothetical protein
MRGFFIAILSEQQAKRQKCEICRLSAEGARSFPQSQHVGGVKKAESVNFE